MQVKIQGGRKIRRLRHQHQNKHQFQKSQYKYQMTTTTNVKHQKYHQQQQQQQHKTHIYNHMKNQDILSSPSSSSSEQTTIAFAPQPQKHKQHKQHKQHQHHLRPEFHLQPLPSPPPPSSAHHASSHQRTKRSISSPRHVETLIVADSTMVVFHNEIETYLLTIMNMVSALYKDPSIGNAIEIVVVRILLLDDDEAHPDLNLTQNAQQNLDTFCR